MGFGDNQLCIQIDEENKKGRNNGTPPPGQSDSDNDSHAPPPDYKNYTLHLQAFH